MKTTTKNGSCLLTSMLAYTYCSSHNTQKLFVLVQAACLCIKKHCRQLEYQYFSTRYRNRRNFRCGSIFANFGPTKNAKIILHMRIACHKNLYCTGQNNEIKSRRKIKNSEEIWKYPKLKPLNISTIMVIYINT